MSEGRYWSWVALPEERQLFFERLCGRFNLQEIYLSARPYKLNKPRIISKSEHENRVDSKTVAFVPMNSPSAAIDVCSFINDNAAVVISQDGYESMARISLTDMYPLSGHCIALQMTEVEKFVKAYWRKRIVVGAFLNKPPLYRIVKYRLTLPVREFCRFGAEIREGNLGPACAPLDDPRWPESIRISYPNIDKIISILSPEELKILDLASRGETLLNSIPKA